MILFSFVIQNQWFLFHNSYIFHTIAIRDNVFEFPTTQASEDRAAEARGAATYLRNPDHTTGVVKSRGYDTVQLGSHTKLAPTW